VELGPSPFNLVLDVFARLVYRSWRASPSDAQGDRPDLEEDQ